MAAIDTISDARVSYVDKKVNPVMNTMCFTSEDHKAVLEAIAAVKPPEQIPTFGADSDLNKKPMDDVVDVKKEKEAKISKTYPNLKIEKDEEFLFDIIM